MSFVKWGSDNFKSDLYAFEHINGSFHLCIAGMRHKRDENDNPIFTDEINITTPYMDEIKHPWAGEVKIYDSLPKLHLAIAYAMTTGLNGRPNLLEDLDEEIYIRKSIVRCFKREIGFTIRQWQYKRKMIKEQNASRNS